MNLEAKFKQTLKKINPGKKEKILVALSGGKDSSVVAYLLKKFGYNIEGFHIDLGMGDYSRKCLEAAKKLCSQLGIVLHIYDIKNEMGSSMCYIRSAIQAGHGKGLKNCAICGVIKKWIMNREARKLNADKIATGHNLDDECQTFLMNILKGSPQLSANSGAITRNIEDRKFITRIKPLFYIAEEDIREYSKKKELPVVYEKCPCALDSYRIQTRQFTNSLTTKEKENFMKNFDRLSDRIEKLKTEHKLNYCEICGEPSRNKICRMCQLVRK
ncbi:TIGR00269 family protein [Candidatus Pacearchaeota archaeon RBG_19FT_COMBO_34_9]|nr:MAG: TIGR00269 family protein [Candidatus Pacearchaeota archaeon RBG_19FT_COMBO_34_9]OGJ16333.1 MAG: TIGR00269 family protein [Candidatus Pacearchaeota archaeon RBG_13_33_26]